VSKFNGQGRVAEIAPILCYGLSLKKSVFKLQLAIAPL